MMKISRISQILSKYRDICPRTEPKYIEILQKMGGAKRLKTAFELYEMALNFCRHNIKEQNPDVSDAELKKKVLERFGYDTGRTITKSHQQAK